MRETAFYWGWRSYAPQPDPLMTRTRMARLMRAWRRATLQGRRLVDFRLTRRTPGRREYSVCSTDYPGEEHTVVIVTLRDESRAQEMNNVR